MQQYPRKPIRWLLSLMLIADQISSAFAVAERAVVTVVDFATWSYGAEIATTYGAALDSSLFYSANLMIPPGDQQMCDFPTELTRFTENVTSPVRFRTHVAIMVSLGGCDVHTKIETALEIYESVSPSLRYIIFYNNDPDNWEEIVPISRPADDTNNSLSSAIDEMAILSMSTGTGTALMSRIQQLAGIKEADPEFLSAGNQRWILPMILEILDERDYNNGRNYYGGSSGNFIWFRFVLFTLLIISPCCRTGYLWWAGGGRIRLRRNESGRITGLQYIPPVSYWFATTGTPDTGPTITDRLTEEQVLAHPVISYVSEEHDGDSDHRSSQLEDLEDVDIVVNSGCEDDPTNSIRIQEGPEVFVSDDGIDEEQAVDGPAPTTTCSTCSICIDEFESGEKLTLLPRCRHAFHTECIMPWLTERQGCCPLCKTNVIGEESETSVAAVPENTSNEVNAGMEAEVSTDFETQS